MMTQAAVQVAGLLISRPDGCGSSHVSSIGRNEATPTASWLCAASRFQSPESCSPGRTLVIRPGRAPPA